MKKQGLKAYSYVFFGEYADGKLNLRLISKNYVKFKYYQSIFCFTAAK